MEKTRTAAIRDTVRPLVETWINGNRKDAIEGLLKMRSKVEVARAAICFYEGLVGEPCAGTNACCQVGILMRLLSEKRGCAQWK